jgi:hypothetical protein
MHLRLCKNIEHIVQRMQYLGAAILNILTILRGFTTPRSPYQYIDSPLHSSPVAILRGVWGIWHGICGIWAGILGNIWGIYENLGNLGDL